MKQKLFKHLFIIAMATGTGVAIAQFGITAVHGDPAVALRFDVKSSNVVSN